MQALARSQEDKEQEEEEEEGKERWEVLTGETSNIHMKQTNRWRGRISIHPQLMANGPR